MGFQGQLSSVQLADLFQTIAMNRQTGTFVVSMASATTQVFFDQGMVAAATAPWSGGMPFLLNAAVRRNLLAPELAASMAGRQRSSGQTVRDLMINQGLQEDLVEELALWCLEELICPLFELTDGTFTFQDGEPTPDVLAADAIQVHTVRLATPQLVMEGTRRKDEWQRIHAIIPDPAALPVVDNDGRTNLRNVELDAEMQKVMRWFDGRHTLDAIANQCGMSRFDVHVIAAQLIQVGVARLRSAQEIVDDALTLRAEGDAPGARELLEHVFSQHRLPEVMRPLAEVCVETKQPARAVELYLELIQSSQDAGDLETAASDLDTVIGLSPEDPELHFERAQVRADLGRSEEAAAGFVTAAQAFLATRDSQRSIDACHRAKNLVPRSPDPHRYLAKAYLQEGQADNAVVEYKSLWHALLSASRPAKALEDLKAILDQDCKFPAVKDQVIAHADASEAVKSARAVRHLIVAATGIIIIAAAVGGWQYYKNTVVRQRGQGEVSTLAAKIQVGENALEHPALLEQVNTLRERYSSLEDVQGQLTVLETGIRKDFETRAKGVLERGNALLDGGDWNGARRAFDELVIRYQGTEVAAQAGSLSERVRQRQVETEVGKDLAEAERRWNALDWTGAVAVLEQVLKRKDLPGALRERLNAKAVDWNGKNHDSSALLERAKRIAQGGDLRASLAAFRRAGEASGESVAQARTLAAGNELALAKAIGEEIRTQASAGRTDAAFAALDELGTLAASAANPEVVAFTDRLEIPFLLAVDSPRTRLVIKRPGVEDQPVRAPAGATGVWTHRLGFRRNEPVTVLAGRPGFATAALTIAAGARQVAGQVVLARGPRWRTDLSGPGATGPVVATNQILVGTGRSTLDTIEPERGALHQIPFPDLVAEFRAPPVLLGERAFVALEETVHAIDLTTRTRAGSWPLDQRLSGTLWVGESELVPGKLVAMAGIHGGSVALFEIDDQGQVNRYPVPEMDHELSGIPTVDRVGGHLLAWIPAGGRLLIWDITGSTPSTLPVPLFSIQSRGDCVGRPTRARVANRDCMLVVDSGGQVLAVDATLGSANERRVVAAWALDASQPSSPVIDKRVAYVAGSDGHVSALDLDAPGKTRWRSPADGGFGPPAGEPAVGRRGLYLTTTTGLLLCLDRATGAERWRVDLGSPAVGGPAALDGRIYTTLKSGQLWCFDEGDE